MAAINAQDLFNRHLPAKLVFDRPGACFAPANIALSKYWGKRDRMLNLPRNSSLSVSLHRLGSTTRITPSPDASDHVFHNGRVVPTGDIFFRNLTRYLDFFRRGQDVPLSVETSNSVSTAAGLASSASGFAALACALDQAFGLELPTRVLSMLARIGSGSASRSFWHGFVQWDRGVCNDGSDCLAHRLACEWPEFRIAIVNIVSAPKSVLSRDGMNHTLETSPLYQAWPEQAERDCVAIRDAILDRNMEKLGTLAEANALAMHATMMAARPALQYLRPESLAILALVKHLRHDGHAVFATIDAGPNVKLVFLADCESVVRAQFPQAQIIKPFAPIEPFPELEQGSVLPHPAWDQANHDPAN